jgi:proteasome lid subunit RPN8/RPN11
MEPIVLNGLQRSAIQEHTLACYPNEMCGIVTWDKFYPLENTSPTPTKHFKFNPIEYSKYVGEATAIIHSHCRKQETREFFDLRTPSLADLKGQMRSNKPWLIVGCDSEVVTPPIQFPRIPSNNYTNRTFMWYINDCYTLVQDYYQFELGIILPTHAFEFDWSDINNLNHVFDKHIANYRFIDLDSIFSLRNGDLLLLNRQGLEANHLGIYHNGEVLHQDHLSRFTPFTNYVGNINRILRYVD